MNNVWHGWIAAGPGEAPSAVAADVLSTETGAAADTIDKLLHEHNLERPPGHRYNLPAGATVIVDEAGMVSTDKLDELCALADGRAARQVLTDHDRPLRRRGHETEITAAKRTIERNPGQIESSRTEHAQQTDRLSDLDHKLAQAEKLNERRPQMNTQLEDIDQRLIDDRRNRSRGAAIDQPGHVIDALGARPDTGKTRHAWDIAAGTLDQHQTAYPSEGVTQASAGHDHSKGLLSNAVGELRRAIQHEQQIAIEHEGPALTRGR